MRPGTVMREVVVGPLMDALVTSGSEVLDLGGFDGSLTAPLVARGAKVSVVDLDEQGIDAARARGLHAVVASAAEIPFPDRTFDVVVCCDLLPCIPLDLQQDVFREIERVLKTDGVLVMTIPDASLSLPFVDMKAAYASWRSQEGLSRERIDTLAERAGIEIFESREYFGLPTRLYYALAFYLNVPRAGTRLKRRVWRYLVKGERWFCPAPQAHLIVARSRGEVPVAARA